MRMKGDATIALRKDTWSDAPVAAVAAAALMPPIFELL
jgi:hypothetical protein